MSLFLSLFRRFLVSYLFFSILLNFFALATPTNITIDDTNSAFVWESGWVAGPCSFCSAQLNQSLTYDGTWHDGGSFSGLTATLNFDGTAVYLFGITSENDTGTIEFTLDGQNATTYNPSVVGVPQMTHGYNISFFAASGLANGSHTLGFTSILASNSSQTVLIDYAIVTVDNSTDSGSSSQSSSPNTNSSDTAQGPNKSGLIGGIVGGIVGAVLLLLGMFLLIRRRRRERPVKVEDNIQPYPAPSFLTGDGSSPPTSATTIWSSTTKGPQPLPISSTPILVSEASPSPADAIPVAYTRARSNSGAATTISESTSSRTRSDVSGTSSAARQQIHEMEERIRSLETMVLLSNAAPSMPAATVMSPASGHTVAYGISEEDMTTPPPPY